MLFNENVPKDEHGLVYKDICPDDRQNFESFRKMTEPRVLHCLRKYIPESEGTVMYLKLCQDVTSAFLNESISASERVHKIWYGIFFLRIWRDWLAERGAGTKKGQSNEYSLATNFISANITNALRLMVILWFN